MNNYYTKYLKYKNKYLIFKKQIGGMTYEVANIWISRDSRTITNIDNYIKEGVIIPEGLPSTLLNYAESKAFQKILRFLHGAYKSLDDTMILLLTIESPDKDQQTTCSIRIEEEKAKAQILMDLVKARIAKLPYNAEEVAIALSEHQKRLGSPPKWTALQPLKESLRSVIGNYEKSQAIYKSARALCVELEKNLVTWNAEGYFKSQLENDADVEYRYFKN
jgi:hypothetical protein